MSFFIKTNSFNSIGAGQTATLDLPTNRMYRQLVVNYGTDTAGGPTQVNMEAEITEVRLNINGKTQRRFSAAELFAINALNGHAVAAGKLSIFFSEPTRRSAQGEDALAWGTADVDTFQVEVDIDAGATNPTISANVLVDYRNVAMGPIVKWRRQNVPITQTGINTSTTFDKTNNYYRIHAFSSDIDDVSVLLDQERVLEGTKAELDTYYLSMGCVPAAAITVLAFDPDQRTSSSLSMVKENKQPVSEFRIDWNMSVAASFNVVSELLGMRD